MENASQLPREQPEPSDTFPPTHIPGWWTRSLRILEGNSKLQDTVKTKCIFLHAKRQCYNYYMYREVLASRLEM